MSNNRLRVVTLAVSATLLAGIGLVSPSNPVPHPQPVRMVACEFEDSPNCFWDASTRGNKRGWVLLNVDGTTYRLWKLV